MIPQFCVGLLFSTASSFVILEKLRDRRLLCEKKFDEGQLNDYIYRQVRGVSVIHNCLNIFI